MDHLRASVCQLCLPGTSFEEDVRTARALGYRGMSLDERKILPSRERECREVFEASGLRAVACAAREWAVLPVAMRPEPTDPRLRVRAICEGIAQLAPYQPETVFVATGGPLDKDETGGRQLVVDALREISRVGAEYGTRISVEPMAGRVSPKITLIDSIAATVRLIEDVGDETIGIVVDTWHMFDSPRFREDVLEHIERVTAVQVADYRVPRTRRDRLMPGDGMCDIPGLMRDLRSAGYAGWYDLEVFSDELWQSMPRDAFMQRGLTSMERCWEESHTQRHGRESGRPADARSAV